MRRGGAPGSCRLDVAWGLPGNRVSAGGAGLRVIQIWGVEGALSGRLLVLQRRKPMLCGQVCVAAPRCPGCPQQAGLVFVEGQVCRGRCSCPPTPTPEREPRRLCA